MTKLVLNILLPRAKVSETYPKDHPWYKRLEVVKNIDGILSKYDNVERHIVFVEETGSMAKLKVLLTNGWSLHATDKNIYSNDALKMFIESNLGFMIETHKKSLYWSFHSIKKLTDQLELDVLFK